ncbi:MAG: hypothetical protein Tsb0034_19560 [Ekhidna sp.]
MQPYLSFIILVFMLACQAQPPQEREVGGPCEGCEALFEYGDRSLNPVDTIPGFERFNSKIHFSGTVYLSDGRTPAENVVIYAYQTNTEGIYAKSENAQGWGQRHGQHRGWVKTGPDGRYTFYTFRPATYPNTTVPQHIHLAVKEPTTVPYYIDAIHFTDDPHLTERTIKNLRNRGGSGLVTPIDGGEMLKIKRDIVLGENIPGY